MEWDDDDDDDDAAMRTSAAAADKVCSIDDLLRKILAELPVSSLRLFKSVCKRWFSLITDPSFSALRSSIHRHRPCGLLLQLKTASSEFAYVPLVASSPTSTSIIRFPFYPTNNNNYNDYHLKYIKVGQSCNGLLLCYDWPDKLYVYNPTINRRRLLPLPRTWKPYRYIRNLALAFDPAISPHYKILYAREDFSPGSDTCVVHVEIYSSQTGIWRPCAHTTFTFASFVAFDARLVYWHGAIHWLSCISVFHFSIQDIHNPHFIQVEDHQTLYGTTYCAYDKLLVSQHRDCLLLVRMLCPLHTVLYQMTCYSSGWSLKYHVNLEDSPPSFPGPEFKVLCAVLLERDEDSFVVLEVTAPGSSSGSSMFIMRYNIISNTFHHLCHHLTQIPLRETQFCSFLFTPSLVGV